MQRTKEMLKKYAEGYVYFWWANRNPLWMMVCTVAWRRAQRGGDGGGGILQRWSGTRSDTAAAENLSLREL